MFPLDNYIVEPIENKVSWYDLGQESIKRFVLRVPKLFSLVLHVAAIQGTFKDGLWQVKVCFIQLLQNLLHSVVGIILGIFAMKNMVHENKRRARPDLE